MKRKLVTGVWVLAVLGMATTALASNDAFWAGGSGGDWNVAANWDDEFGNPFGRVPAAATDDWPTIDDSPVPSGGSCEDCCDPPLGAVISDPAPDVNGFTIGTVWHADPGVGAVTVQDDGSLEGYNSMYIGDGDDGYLTIYDAGEVIAGVANGQDSFSGHNGLACINLWGGSLTVWWLDAGPGTCIDITTGKLVSRWNDQGDVDDWIADGKLTAYGCCPLIEGEIVTHQEGDWFVIEAIPEPATLALLALGSLGFFRKRRA